MYLEAALTYMLYCASKEVSISSNKNITFYTHNFLQDEGDPDKDVMLTTILLLK